MGLLTQVGQCGEVGFGSTPCGLRRGINRRMLHVLGQALDAPRLLRPMGPAQGRPFGQVAPFLGRKEKSLLSLGAKMLVLGLHRLLAEPVGQGREVGLFLVLWLLHVFRKGLDALGMMSPFMGHALGHFPTFGRGEHPFSLCLAAKRQGTPPPSYSAPNRPTASPVSPINPVRVPCLKTASGSGK